MNKSLFYLIVGCSLLRIFLAVVLNLGNDEVYYVTYAEQLAWNYFDHPPLVGLAIRLFTLDFLFTPSVLIRLPAIIAAAINTWLIFKCGTLIRSQRTGLIAAVLYNTSIYTSIIAGLFILPDSIQVVFWLWAIYLMLKGISDRAYRSNTWHVLLGLSIALATLSKIHGLFLLFGYLGYVLVEQRKNVKLHQLLTVVFIALWSLAPIVYWNIQYDFVTWKFHSERVEFNLFQIDFKSFFVTLFGQIFYNNPFNALLYVIALIHVSRKGRLNSSEYVKLLLWVSIPMLFCTTFLSLYRTVLPHWSGPASIGLMLIASLMLDKTALYIKSLKSIQWIYKATFSFTLVLIVVAMGFIFCFPGSLGQKTGKSLGKNDFTLDLNGWDRLSFEVKKILDHDPKIDVKALLIHKWFPGGHLHYYVARPLGMATIGEGKLTDLHQFAWLNSQERTLLKGENALFISPSNNDEEPVLLYEKLFQEIKRIKVIPQYRQGAAVRYWYVYLLSGAKKNIPGLKPI